MAPVVRMESITKRFGALVANDRIDFSLEAGETHALVGENGAGKTTLMRILYGQYAPDAGKILINGEPCSYHVSGALKHGIGMVHQNFMQIDHMSITENIILGHAPTRADFIDYRAAKEKIRGLLARFGMQKISPDTPIGNLCVGERQKIEIIKALYLGARVLILDEPTAVLTPQESDELFSVIDELKKDGTSIVFISHKLREVIRVADRITVMRKGRVVAHFKRGEASETDVARAMIGKQDVQLIQNSERGEVGEPVCVCKNLWYIDGNGIPRIRDLTFAVRRGEILGVGGVEGNGQTELINLLIGMFRLSGGSILLDGEDVTRLPIRQRRAKGVGYISEDRMTTGLALQANADENLIC
uniref:ABC transporter ATP-binding protein n=3 Tax=Oscillospiraceae TaxID=216572 RepID=UPI003AEF4C32